MSTREKAIAVFAEMLGPKRARAMFAEADATFPILAEHITREPLDCWKRILAKGTPVPGAR